MDGEDNETPLLEWMIWGEKPYFGNIHIYNKPVVSDAKTVVFFFLPRWVFGCNPPREADLEAAQDKK